MAIGPQPTTGLPFRLGVADLNHHEYFDGEVFAMTGGSLPHADIALNIATYLRSQLGGGRCKVRNSDAKVGITETGPFMPYGKGQEIELISIGLTVPMAIIYEDVVLVQSPATQCYYQPPIED